MASEDIGYLIKTQIPTYEDPADIQSALRLYHYGSTTYDKNNEVTSNLVANSMAWHIQQIKDSLAAIVSINVTSLPSVSAGNDLDTRVSLGFFHQATNAGARAGDHYPTHDDSLAYAGVLTVLVKSDFIYQTYQMSGESSGTNPNSFFWRSKPSSGNWSPWITASKVGHSHNDLYYTESEIASGAASGIITSNLSAGKALISSSTGKVDISAVTTTQLEYLKSLTGTTGTASSKLVFSESPVLDGSVTITNDLPVTEGGTGASDASGARTNLSAAKSGANSDITSLSGLTTPLSLAQGGTGGATKFAAKNGVGIYVYATAAEITAAGHVPATGDIWIW